MRIVILVLFAAVAVYGQVHACNTQAVQEAQSILDEVTGDVQRGTASPMDQTAAKTHLLEMKLCKTPDDKQICKDLIDSLNKEFSEAKQKKAMGIADIFEVIAVHEKLVKAKINCGY